MLPKLQNLLDVIFTITRSSGRVITDFNVGVFELCFAVSPKYNMVIITNQIKLFSTAKLQLAHTKRTQLPSPKHALRMPNLQKEC
jgi:hypothetical protein